MYLADKISLPTLVSCVTSRSRLTMTLMVFMTVDRRGKILVEVGGFTRSVDLRLLFEVSNGIDDGRVHRWNGIDFRWDIGEISISRFDRIRRFDLNPAVGQPMRRADSCNVVAFITQEILVFAVVRDRVRFHATPMIRTMTYTTYGCAREIKR